MECLYGRIRVPSELIDKHLLLRNGAWLQPRLDSNTWEGVVYAYNTSPARRESRELVTALRRLAAEITEAAEGIEAFNNKPYPQTGSSSVE